MHIRIDNNPHTDYFIPMNIRELLSKLKEIGMTDTQIAEAIGAPQSIVTRLKNGDHKTTNYERGEAIRKLAEKKLPNIYQ